MRIDDTAPQTGFASTLGGARPATPRDEFLRLLVAQLQNQNPLEPQDGADFVAQLAQFASVEQSEQTNQRLAELQMEQAAAANAGLAAFVGKEATVVASQFEMSGKPGGVPGLEVELSGAIKSGSVVIRDAAGNEVKRIELSPQPEGRVTIPWDGTDAQGVTVGKGIYSIEVEATAPNGGNVAAHAELRGEIEAIEFINGFPRLRIGAATVAPGDVLSIR